MFSDGEIKPLGAAAEVLAADGPASAKPGFVNRLIHGGYAASSAGMANFGKAGGRLDGTRVL